MADGGIVLKTIINDTDLKKFIKTLKGLFSIGVLTAFIKNVTQAGARIDEMSQKLGMSKKSFQQWDYIAKLSDTTMESLQMQMSRLAVVAENNSGVITNLGVAVKNQDGTFRTQEEIFRDTISALQMMPEGINRNNAAISIFGRSAAELNPLLNRTVGEMSEMRNSAPIMTDAQIAALDEFGDSIISIKENVKVLGAELAPVAKSAAEFIRWFTRKLSDDPVIRSGILTSLSKEYTSLQQVKDAIKEYTTKFRESNEELYKRKQNLATLTSTTAGMFANASEIDAESKAIKTLNEQTQEYQNTLQGLVILQKDMLGASGTGGATPKTGEVNESLEASKAQFSAFAAFMTGGLSGINNDNMQTSKAFEEAWIQTFASCTDAFGAMGEALALGKNPLVAFANSTKDVLAGILDNYVDTVISKGIFDEFVTGKIGAMAKGIAMAAAIKMAAGMIRAKNFATGGLVPGNPATGDSVPAMLTPHEIVLNAAQIKNVAGAISGGGMTVVVNNYSNSEVSTQNNGKELLITIREITLDTMQSRQGKSLIRNISSAGGA